MLCKIKTIVTFALASATVTACAQQEEPIDPLLIGAGLAVAAIVASECCDGGSDSSGGGSTSLD
ncbi:MAG: hypothetical protein QNJ20_03125 [Paracoccaceae bacterium]|nr:hypothetical protein [Paracoccaceae bacterium]